MDTAVEQHRARFFFTDWRTRLDSLEHEARGEMATSSGVPCAHLQPAAHLRLGCYSIPH